MQKKSLGLIIVLICFMLLSQPFQAQTLVLDAKGDGQVVICHEGDKETYRLFDFYEDKNFSSAFPLYEVSAFDKVAWLLSQIKVFHPELIDSLDATLRVLPNQIKYISSSPSILQAETDDDKSQLKKSENQCRWQRILFYSLNPEKDQRFSVVEGVWQKLKSEDQAGLILNAILSENFSSRKILVEPAQLRKIVRLWSQGGPKKIGISRYVNESRGLEKALGKIVLDGVVYALDPRHPLKAYENGQIETGMVEKIEKDVFYKKFIAKDIEFNTSRGPIKMSFHSTGVPRSLLLDQPIVEIPIQGKRIKFKYEVAFHPNGQVREGIFLSDYGLHLLMTDGRIRRFKNMEYYIGIFDSAGNLISARRQEGATNAELFHIQK